MNPSEAQLLDAIGGRPDDEEARRRYADWLEEHGERDKAEFLRAQAAFRSPSDAAQFHEAVGRLRDLLPRIDARWRARVAQRRLTRCTFVLECPQEWGALHPTQDPMVRRCDACQRQVHYCTTIQDVTRHAEAGACVAVDMALGFAEEHPPIAQVEIPQVTMGIVMIPERIPEKPTLWGRIRRWFGG